MNIPCGKRELADSLDEKLCFSNLKRQKTDFSSYPQIKKPVKVMIKAEEAVVSQKENSINSAEIMCKSHIGWDVLPSEALMRVFSHLPVKDLGRAAQVCSHWYNVAQFPQLWQRAEFVLSHASKSDLQPTRNGLINYILQHHAKHLKFVIFKTDSSVESAEMACHILSKLANCSLKTLALVSSARPVFLDVDQKLFVSALTVVFDHSQALSSLAIDNTPVDDPSLEALASSNSQTLQLLRMKSCPRVSPEGMVALADNCRCLRELSVSYTLVSDDLLMTLSSEKHVRLDCLQIDVYTEKDMVLQTISPQCWQALIQHSPTMNLVMYFFVIPDESFDALFTSFVPVTHLYFGDYAPNPVLGRIGQHCPRLKELVVGANGNSFINDELLNIAKNCPNLTSVGLGECEVTCSAFVEFAKICGPRLKELYVMEECLIEDAQFDVSKTCKYVSEFIQREWTPEFVPQW